MKGLEKDSAKDRSCDPMIDVRHHPNIITLQANSPGACRLGTETSP